MNYQVIYIVLTTIMEMLLIIDARQIELPPVLLATTQRHQSTPSLLSTPRPTAKCIQNEYDPGCKYCVAQDTCNGGHYTCDPKTGNKVCLPGWKGASCTEKDVAIESFFNLTCPDNSCRNGGVCVSGTCCCQKGYTGVLCQIETIECKSRPCQNGGLCRDLVGHYECSCSPGYTGKNCETHLYVTTPSVSLKPGCNPYTCKNGGTCYEGSNSTYCVCPLWYTGKYCENQLNVSTVIQNETCPMNMYGQNCSVYCVPHDSCKDGHYICDPVEGKKICLVGWMGVNCGIRRLPQALDTVCPMNLTCKNGGQCFDGRCCCKHQYSGEFCNVISIGCLSSPCQNGAECVPESKLVTNYSCNCKAGFTGELCEIETTGRKNLTNITSIESHNSSNSYSNFKDSYSTETPSSPETVLPSQTKATMGHMTVSVSQLNNYTKYSLTPTMEYFNLTNELSVLSTQDDTSTNPTIPIQHMTSSGSLKIPKITSVTAKTPLITVSTDEYHSDTTSKNLIGTKLYSTLQVIQPETTAQPYTNKASSGMDDIISASPTRSLVYFKTPDLTLSELTTSDPMSNVPLPNVSQWPATSTTPPISHRTTAFSFSAGTENLNITTSYPVFTSPISMPIDHDNYTVNNTVVQSRIITSTPSILTTNTNNAFITQTGNISTSSSHLQTNFHTQTKSAPYLVNTPTPFPIISFPTLTTPTNSSLKTTAISRSSDLQTMKSQVTQQVHLASFVPNEQTITPETYTSSESLNSRSTLSSNSSLAVEVTSEYTSISDIQHSRSTQTTPSPANKNTGAFAASRPSNFSVTTSPFNSTVKMSSQSSNSVIYSSQGNITIISSPPPGIVANITLTPSRRLSTPFTTAPRYSSSDAPARSTKVSTITSTSPGKSVPISASPIAMETKTESQKQTVMTSNNYSYDNTTASPLSQPDKHSVSWWIIIVGIVVGVLFLAALSITLVVLFRFLRSTESRTLKRSPEELHKFDKEHFSAEPEFANPGYDVEGPDFEDDSSKSDIYIVNR